MKLIQKLKLFILILLLSIVLFGCKSNEEKKEEQQHDDPITEPIFFGLELLINYYDNASLDLKMADLDYTKLDYDCYTLYRLPYGHFEGTYCIDSAYTLSKLSFNDAQFELELKSNYPASFFDNHVLIITNYELVGSNNIMRRMYYSHDDFCFVYDTCEGTPTHYCYFIEIDLDSFIMNKKLNYDIQYTPELFKANFTSFSSRMESEKEDQAIIPSSLPQLDSPLQIIRKYEDKTSYITIEDETELHHFSINWNSLSVIKTELNKNSYLLFTIESGDYIYQFYDQLYLTITHENQTVSYYIVKGNPYFIYYSMFYKSDSLYQFDINLMNMLMNAYQQHALTAAFLDQVMPILLKWNDLELANDFNELSTFEQIDTLLSYSDLYQSNEETTLKELLNIFKDVFKKNINDQLSFNIYYKIHILNDENSSIIDVSYDAYYGEHIELEFQLKDKYLYCGCIDKNQNLYDIFDYYFYCDLYLTPIYTFATNYDIQNIDDDVVITHYNGTETNVYVPIACSKGFRITKIGDKAFLGNKTIQTISINTSKIGNYAFKNCDIETLTLKASITSLGTNLFENCKKLKNVTFQEGFNKLAPYLFKDCISLEEIHLPASLIDCSDHVFEGCDSLSILTVNPNNTKYYSANNCIMEDTTLYYGCKTSTVPEGTVFIREYAFAYIKTLEYIYIPSCVVHIDTGCFMGCSGLKEAYISQSCMYNAKDTFNTGYNTIINCEYYEKMSGWHKSWTTGTTVNWSVPQPTK